MVQDKSVVHTVKTENETMTQVCLITGASAGLGVGFARRLAAEKKQLVLVARRLDKMEILAAELRNTFGIQVFVEACDLSAPNAVKILMGRLKIQNLEVECLINNAGFGLNGNFAELDGDKQAAMITLNCTALTELCHAVLPAMISRNSGQILNVASVAAFQAGPFMAVYYASKAYVLSFSEALHEEVKQHGIHVSALCPGATATEFFAEANMGGSMLAKMAKGPDQVVADGLRGLKINKAFVVSGVLNKLLVQSTRFAPRFITRKIAKSLQR
jgi:uncharacterized protein